LATGNAVRPSSSRGARAKKGQPMQPERRRGYQAVLTLLFTLLAMSFLATTAAIGARALPSRAATGAQAATHAAANQRAATQGPQPGRYKGKTTAGTATPTGVNQVIMEVQQSRSRHRLELTVIGFYQVATCQDGSHTVVSLTGFLLHPPLISGHLNRPLSVTYGTYSSGVKAPTGTVHFVINFTSSKHVTGTLSTTKKLPSGQVCTTGTRPFEMQRWANVPSVR
jgi:hypothetical protein